MPLSILNSQWFSESNSYPPSLGWHLPFSTRIIVLTRGISVPPRDIGQHLGDIFGCHNWSEERRILLNILQCKKTASHYTENYLIQMSVVSRLRNLASAVQSSLWFSKHARLFHILLFLKINGFLYLECPSLPSRSRNDHLSSRIQFKMSSPLNCPFQNPQSQMCLLLSSQSLIRALATQPQNYLSPAQSKT